MKKHLKLIGTMMALSGLLLINSCGPDPEPPTPPVKPIAVTGVSLNKDATSLTVGGTETLTATVTPTDATDKTVTWTSTATTVATVANGLVTAVAEGSTKIIVTAGNYKDTCTVAVVKGSTIGGDKNIVKVQFGTAPEWTAAGIVGAYLPASGGNPSSFIIIAKKSSTVKYPTLQFGGLSDTGSYTILNEGGFVYTDSSMLTDGTNQISDWLVAQDQNKKFVVSVVVTSFDLATLTVSGSFQATLLNTFDYYNNGGKITSRVLKGTYTNMQLQAATAKSSISTKSMIKSTSTNNNSGPYTIDKRIGSLNLVRK